MEHRQISFCIGHGVVTVHVNIMGEQFTSLSRGRVQWRAGEAEEGHLRMQRLSVGFSRTHFRAEELEANRQFTAFGEANSNRNMPKTEPPRLLNSSLVDLPTLLLRLKELFPLRWRSSELFSVKEWLGASHPRAAVLLLKDKSEASWQFWNTTNQPFWMAWFFPSGSLQHSRNTRSREHIWKAATGRLSLPRMERLLEGCLDDPCYLSKGLRRIASMGQSIESYLSCKIQKFWGRYLANDSREPRKCYPSSHVCFVFGEFFFDECSLVFHLFICILP